MEMVIVKRACQVSDKTVFTYNFVPSVLATTGGSEGKTALWDVNLDSIANTDVLFFNHFLQYKSF